MIGSLRGVIIEKAAPDVLLEVGGVGYELQLPLTCFQLLPERGQVVHLFTHLSVREDAQQLYGFSQPVSRALFRRLIKVNGVGPKLALSILSGLSVSAFIQAIQQGDTQPLLVLSGVGKKTAERLILELKDKVEQDPHFSTLINQYGTHYPEPLPSGSLPDSNAYQVALSALIGLGYKLKEARELLDHVFDPDAAPEVLIRHALRASRPFAVSPQGIDS